jgi:hypothetical protein
MNGNTNQSADFRAPRSQTLFGNAYPRISVSLVWKAFAIITLAMAGCINPHPFGLKDADQRDASKADAARRPVTVYAREVNEDNANAMAQALDEEMNYDARGGDQKTASR